MVVVAGASVVRARLLNEGRGLGVVTGACSCSSSSSEGVAAAVVPRVEGVGRVKMFLRSDGIFRAGAMRGALVVVLGGFGVESRGFNLKRLPPRLAGVDGFSVVLLVLLLTGSSYSYSIISYS